MSTQMIRFCCLGYTLLLRAEKGVRLATQFLAQVDRRPVEPVLPSGRKDVAVDRVFQVGELVRDIRRDDHDVAGSAATTNPISDTRTTGPRDLCQSARHDSPRYGDPGPVGTADGETARLAPHPGRGPSRRTDPPRPVTLALSVRATAA